MIKGDDMSDQELVVSMDIGTRTVIGMAGVKDGDIIKILAWDLEEHKERAMYDGQVHDVEQVAKAVRKVKLSLEAQIGKEIKKVAVAAAGRSLRTYKVAVERDIDPKTEIERDTVSSLEVEGIQIAQKEIEKKNDDYGTSYFCVGYTVINHYLNDNLMGKLEGHKGSKIAVEILATFLPRVVVDSLYSVVAKAGLEVASLTLEPIAAMNVVLHSNLRLLNVAMVDIGAGTSDIAITKGGSVVAFAMAPTAGDEITECLAELYLLDFATAEKVKISLAKKSKIKFKDIMGIEYNLTADEIMEKIKPSIKNLAKEISQKIEEYNGKAPSAIFLIGGGSQIPMLPQYLSEALGMPVDRVAVRRADIVKDVEIKNKKSLGPEFITPMGIASTATTSMEKDFLQVSVNGKAVRLFNSKKLTIADSLVLSGINARQLIGKRGSAITININGKAEVFMGEHAEPAVILKNNEKATLDSPIKSGDAISIKEATDGKSAIVTLSEVMGDVPEFKLFIDGKERVIESKVTVNGKKAELYMTLKDKDCIGWETTAKVSELRKSLNIPADVAILRGSRVLDKDEDVIRNDRLTLGVNPADEPEEITQDMFNQMLLAPQNNINTRKIEAPAPISAPSFESALGKATCEAPHQAEIGIIFNGKSLVLKGNEHGYIFADALSQSNTDFSRVKGLKSMKLNGFDANFTDVLKNGDKIEITVE